MRRRAPAADAVLLIPIRANGHAGIARALPCRRGRSRKPSGSPPSSPRVTPRSCCAPSPPATTAAPSAPAPRCSSWSARRLPPRSTRPTPRPRSVRIAATSSARASGSSGSRRTAGSMLAGSYGLEADSDLGAARELAAGGARGGRYRPRSSPAEQLPAGCGVATALALGQPPVGVLQLLFAPGDEPDTASALTLTTFGVRAAHALRSGARTRALERRARAERAVLAVVGQATRELSLAHTLETAVERVAELSTSSVSRVYLRTRRRARPGRRRGLAGPHARVAERLLESRSARARPRGGRVRDVSTTTAARGVHDAAARVRYRSGARAPLARARRGDRPARRLSRSAGAGRPRTRRPARRARGPARRRGAERAAARAATGAEPQREAALASEREASQRLRALYEISRSFAQSLSLEATLEALAARRGRARRRCGLIANARRPPRAAVPRALARRRTSAARGRGSRDPLPAAAVRRGRRAAALPRTATPYRLDRDHEVLGPFLAKGWTGAVVPVATPAEVIASLTHLLFRPGEPDRRGDDRRRARDRRRRPRSRSTTRGSTSSRRSSPTRCSARCCRASSPTSRASRSARCTSRRRTSTSAATSTTS